MESAGAGAEKGQGTAGAGGETEDRAGGREEQGTEKDGSNGALQSNPRPDTEHQRRREEVEGLAPRSRQEIEGLRGSAIRPGL